MKNHMKKISMSVIAGTIILGSIAGVEAAPVKTTYIKNICKYRPANCKGNANINTPNNNTTTNQNNQAENTQKPVEKPVQKPATDNSVSAIESEVLRLVNVERSKEGLAPLKMSNELSSVARKKSQDMADKNYFSHTSPTYGSPFDMMKQFGIKYTAAGENIAKGYNGAEAVMKGWMNSPGHKANILSPKFGTLGVGYVNKNGTTYWTQMFTN